jgi:stage II sporulation protein D
MIFLQLSVHGEVLKRCLGNIKFTSLNLIKTKYFLFKLFSLSLLSVVLFLSSCSTEEIQKEESQDSTKVVLKPKITVEKEIKVLIESDLPKNEIVFSVPSELRFQDSLLTSVKAKEKIKVQVKDQNIELKIGKKIFLNPYFDFVPRQKQNLDYNKKSYAGNLQLVILENNPAIVNILNLEDYIESVVSSELGKLITRQNIEAVKALAVCIRNYSMVKIKEGKTAYDVFDDERDQVYNGIVKPNSVLDSAMNKTLNQFLIFDNEIAQVFYFSSCGGLTEDCEHVFPNLSVSYLRGVKDGDGPYCNISPSFNWEETYTEKQLLSLLNQAGYLDEKKWNLVDISIESRYLSERVNNLTIFVNNDKGENKQIVLQGNLIRSVIKTNKGKSILKSTVFDIAVKKKNNEIEEVKFIGKGNGHGVGLCQWGAIGQAKAGKNYNEILSFYFPGTSLETLND